MAPLTLVQREARERRRDQVHRLYDEDLTDEAIGERLGLDVRTVRRDREARGIRGRRPVRADDQRARAVSLRRQLWTVEAIAGDLGVTPGRVSVYLRQELDEEERRRIQTAIYAQRQRTAPRVERECDWCSEPFERAESYMRHHRDDAHHFCSAACLEAWLWEGPNASARRDKLRAVHDGISATLADQGLVGTNEAAGLTSWSAASLRQGKIALERREFGGIVRLGANAREVLRASPDKHARRKLSKPLAALNGTDSVGAPRKLTATELELAISLRAADPKVWGWRTIAAKLNESRGPDQQVSHMTVKRRLLELAESSRS